MSNLDKILQVLHKNENEIILLLFTADWCKPCKQLKERLSTSDDEYAKQLLNLKYIVIDIDDPDNEELCDKFNITNIPHQIFITLIKNNDKYEIKKLDELIGNDIIGLVTKFSNLIN